MKIYVSVLFYRLANCKHTFLCLCNITATAKHNTTMQLPSHVQFDRYRYSILSATNKNMAGSINSSHLFFLHKPSYTSYTVDTHTILQMKPIIESNFLSSLWSYSQTPNYLSIQTPHHSIQLIPRHLFCSNHNCRLYFTIFYYSTSTSNHVVYLEKFKPPFQYNILDTESEIGKHHQVFQYNHNVKCSRE